MKKSIIGYFVSGYNKIYLDEARTPFKSKEKALKYALKEGYENFGIYKIRVDKIGKFKPKFVKMKEG